MENIKKMMTMGCVLACLMISSSAFAGGPGGGGGKGGGNDDGGVKITLSNGGLVYNSKLPAGTVTLGYSANGTAQSMTYVLSNINVPDGTALPVHVIMGRLQSIFTYYQITQVVYTEMDGYIVINHGAANLYLSKLKGDVIPNFPSATQGSGTTEIRILTPNKSTVLLDGIAGKFHA